MAVLYVYESPEAKLDIYDRLSAQVRSQGMPAGGLQHTACLREGGGLFVVEVWESEEAHDKWDKEISERIRSAGGPPRPTPRKLPVHNMMSRDKV
jgi:heme-degrading monooxygenase HmoA